MISCTLWSFQITIVFFQITSYEKEPPLAFSIMVHDQVGLFEAQLASIFKPHNSYCIFVDQKAEKKVHDLVSGIVKCYKQKYPQVSDWLNLFVKTHICLALQANIFKTAKSHRVYWAHISMLLGDLKCLNLLLDSDKKR